jgi:hypothetical protein
MPSYPFPFQVKLVRSIFVVHNFINNAQQVEDMFYDFEQEEEPHGGGQRNQGENDDNRAAREFRERIADEMWDDYLDIINERL